MINMATQQGEKGSARPKYTWMQVQHIRAKQVKGNRLSIKAVIIEEGTTKGGCVNKKTIG